MEQKRKQEVTEEAQHYFKLATQRLENKRQTLAQNNASYEDRRVLEFVLELVKEQVPNENSGSTTR